MMSKIFFISQRKAEMHANIRKIQLLPIFIFTKQSPVKPSIKMSIPHRKKSGFFLFLTGIIKNYICCF